LIGLTIDAPKGWSAPRALEAERVTIVPDLRSLVTDRIRISSIIVEKPYLAMLRTPGKLTMVPSLTESEGDKKSRQSAPAVAISTIEIKDGTVELYDATVSRPPLRTRMEQIDAVIEDCSPQTSVIRRSEVDVLIFQSNVEGRA
jgi:uncharacterized protein involved in outer membrane biogenesis